MKRRFLSLNVVPTLGAALLALSLAGCATSGGVPSDGTGSVTDRKGSSATEQADRDYRALRSSKVPPGALQHLSVLSAVACYPLRLVTSPGASPG